MQKIWFRRGEAAWFLTVRENGQQKQLRLLSGPNDRDTRQEGRGTGHPGTGNAEGHAAPRTASWITAGHVLDGFLLHSQQEHEPETYEWYKVFWLFNKSCGSAGRGLGTLSGRCFPVSEPPVARS